MQILRSLATLLVVMILLINGQSHVLSQEGDGSTLDGMGATLSSAGGSIDDEGGLGLLVTSQPPSYLSRQDYQNVYNQAYELGQHGLDFRQNELQLLPSNSITRTEDIKNNYQNFNGGDLYYRFCFDYSGITSRGYCPEANRDELARKVSTSAEGGTLGPEVTEAKINIRNQMLAARSLYTALLLAEPPNVEIQAYAEDKNGTKTLTSRRAREVGREGILEMTREIAYVHIIFGNEFLVDATDYRFGGPGWTAEKILEEEFALLDKAKNQFELASNVLLDSFHTDIGWPSKVFVADMFTPREFELFAVATESMVTALDEEAIRYRQQREDAIALTTYQDAFTTSYLQSAALAQNVADRCEEKAEENHLTGTARKDSIDRCFADFTATGAPLLLSSLELLRNRAQVIRSGVNPFGFTDKYVPLQLYGDYADSRSIRGQAEAFYAMAKEDEQAAFNAQRDFDQSRDAINKRLLEIPLTYDTQLLQICGKSSDDTSNNFETCMNNIACDAATLAQNPGELKQNYCALAAAGDNISAIRQQIENLNEKIVIEQSLVKDRVEMLLQNAGIQGAFEVSKGIESRVRTTVANIDSSTQTSSLGFGFSQTASCTAEFGLKFLFSGCSATGSTTQHIDFDWADATIDSTTTTTDEDAVSLAKLTRDAILEDADIRAEMEKRNSEAQILTWLLEKSTLEINKHAAEAEFNRLVMRHNHLGQQYHHWKNLRDMAVGIELDSYLNNPIYRILRENLTIQSSRSFRIAAQYAYLAAKALEYEYLMPLNGGYDALADARKPNIDDIFSARTAAEIGNFLTALDNYRRAKTDELGVISRSHTPYSISVRERVFGLSERVEDNGSFNSMLLRYYDVNSRVLRIPFVTTLEQFDTSLLWNYRIAPVDPNNPNIGCSPGCNGVAVSILHRPGVFVGTPQIRIEHGGTETFMDREGNVVEYTPGNSSSFVSGLLVDYGSSTMIENQLGRIPDRPRRGTVTAGFDCEPPPSPQMCGIPTSELFNLSPAASSWFLVIDLSDNAPSNKYLKLEMIDDIIIYMDVTRISRP
ncbi:MAG: hypothetical protein M9936_00345 [Caldilinea sp.]|nr:hypothetical protein [Caldilineaceae bacterium]MCO5208112.1 hypothetical protein [Caldilinea sp.]MCW5842825.1 hypothetical protein [Caldilinea sp.]